MLYEQYRHSIQHHLEATPCMARPGHPRQKLLREAAGVGGPGGDPEWELAWLLEWDGTRTSSRRYELELELAMLGGGVGGCSETSNLAAFTLSCHPLSLSSFDVVAVLCCFRPLDLGPLFTLFAPRMFVPPLCLLLSI